MDDPRDHQTDHPVMPSEAELVAIMGQSDRDVALGQMVAVTDVLAELDDVAKEIKTRHGARSA